MGGGTPPDAARVARRCTGAQPQTLPHRSGGWWDCSATIARVALRRVCGVRPAPSRALPRRYPSQGCRSGGGNNRCCIRVDRLVPIPGRPIDLPRTQGLERQFVPIVSGCAWCDGGMCHVVARGTVSSRMGHGGGGTSRTGGGRIVLRGRRCKFGRPPTIPAGIGRRVLKKVPPKVERSERTIAW